MKWNTSQKPSIVADRLKELYGSLKNYILSTVIFHGTSGAAMTGKHCSPPSCWYPFFSQSTGGVHEAWFIHPLTSKRCQPGENGCWECIDRRNSSAVVLICYSIQRRRRWGGVTRPESSMSGSHLSDAVYIKKIYSLLLQFVCFVHFFNFCC